MLPAQHSLTGLFLVLVKTAIHKERKRSEVWISQKLHKDSNQLACHMLSIIAKHKIRGRKGKTLTKHWREFRTKATHKHMETYSKYFDGHRRFSHQKRVNVCEQTKITSLESFWKASPGFCKKGRDGGKFKRNYLIIPRSTAQAGRQKKTLKPNKTCRRCCKNNERPTRNYHNYLNGTKVKPENKDNSNFDSNWILPIGA
jgi:hypothetical protein